MITAGRCQRKMSSQSQGHGDGIYNHAPLPLTEFQQN